MDELLKRDYDNIVVMLFDGMGALNLKSALLPGSFLLSRMKKGISSVFPSTTVAAINSVESGNAPIEHAWIGWSQYFKEIDKKVDVFTNMSDGSLAADYSVAQRALPHKRIFEKIRQKGFDAFEVSPFGDKTDTLDGIFKTAGELLSRNGKKYIYTYWCEPDAAMHEFGVDSPEAARAMQEINDKAEAFCNQAAKSNTLVIITADHGLIDCVNIDLCGYPDILECLERDVSLEGRTCAFYIKDGFFDKFETEFKKHFSDKFLLLSAEEFVKKGFLGSGKEHERVYDFIGDYVALAIDKYALRMKDDKVNLIGMHAGLSENEMTVPFIVGLE